MIRVHRWLDDCKVREMCIRYRYYTCGDNTAYSNMLAMARDEDADNYEWVKQIAIDIYDHSTVREDKEYTAKEHIEGIMNMLLSECVEMYVELDESEVRLS